MNELKEQIQTALGEFSGGNLVTNATGLLNVLGYDSERKIQLSPNNYRGFAELFQTGSAKFDPEKAKVNEWQSIDVIFQLTEDDIKKSHSLFETKKVDNTIIESYLFFALSLAGEKYTRGDLVKITREINKLTPMPAMILFKYNDNLTVAVIDRRIHKREGSKDVLEKVTLIKDINISKPHRAHIEILFDLSLDELQQKTGFSNFVALHNAWRKTLDTSELNKKFFRELANWYFWALKNVEFPDDAEKNKDVRNAISVIRMITRLIFIWFIKEKGLVPDALFNQGKLKSLLDFSDKNQSTYYKAILQNLFFATLNTEMNKDKSGSRKFRGKNKGDGRDQHYMIHNVFRYEDYFTSPQETLEKYFENIPFLNGGLFECLDKITSSSGKDKIIRIDGFSDHPKNGLKVPDNLFFSPEQTVDLNEIYGTRNKTYKVRGLIDILDSYKFTMDENTPIEEEIALDPELLGKVFENLLASYNPETQTTARKQTGSFYTPREIVNYMVDESIIAYLSTKLIAKFSEYSKDEKQLDERLRHLVAYNDQPHEFTSAEVDVLIAAINMLKALDPACGSGAFPMGMLHKLVYILGKLDPDNSKWRDLQKQKAIRETEEAYKIGDKEEREKRLLDISEVFENNASDYGRKLYLIENCIFGVDIQPIAVQISKLRFFVSLIVDQRIDSKKENLGVRPLPNLETKFVAANTLLGIEKPEVPKLSMNLAEIERKEAELRKARERHFAARTQQTKNKWRDEDKRLRSEIAELLRNDGWDNEVARKLAEWNPYDQNAHADFFDSEWMFGIVEGFDISMGNPPYMRVQGLQQTQPEFVPIYRQRYVSAQGSFDIYALFVERGYQLLNSNGLLTYILPHKFFQASFGESLRKLLTKHKALRQIVRFGAEQVFEEATTYTCLLFLTAQPNSSFDLFEVKTLERGREVLEAALNHQEHPDYAYESLPEPQNTTWDFTIGHSNKVLSRLQQHKTTLGSITRKIFVGLQTSADKLYVLSIIEDKGKLLRCYSKYIECEIEIERGLVRPFLMGKDVHRYEPAHPENVVIFPYNLKDGRAELMLQPDIKRRFPLGWDYLSKCKNYLAAREHGRFEEQWWAYGRPQNLTEFETVKIMTPDICAGPQMTIDQTGELYHTTTLYSFVFKPNAGGNAKYFLGLLNSKVLWYFVAVTGTVLRGGYLRFKTEYLKPFPIPESTSKQQKIIEILVDYILHLKSLSQDKIVDASRHALLISYFEQLIDGVVYELYFPEEFDSQRSMTELLSNENLKPLEQIKGDKVKTVRDIFENLYKPEHPVRKCLYFLDSVDAVRVIEEHAK